jgi:glycosyltransferase involved in cell wall biosynthesis
MQTKHLNILYVYQSNPHDPYVQSGRPNSILDQMRRAGHSVDVLVLRSSIFDNKIIAKIFARIWRKPYDETRYPKITSGFAKQIHRYIHLSNMSFDVVFSPSTLPFVHFPRGRLVNVSCVDTLFADLVETYPEFNMSSSSYIDAGNRAESLALSNIDLLVVPSRSAAFCAVDHYGFNDKNIVFAQFGSNLPLTLSEDEIDSNINKRIDNKSVNFLFIGRDWDRKNGIFVAQVCREISAAGYESIVHCIGTDKPDNLDADLERFCKFYGKMNLRSRDGVISLNKVSLETSFFFLPSKAEAFGMSFVEVSTLGLPLIGSSVGGIRDIITEGNGFLLKPEMSPNDVAKLVLSCKFDRERYRSLAKSAWRDSRDRLNWTSFWRSVEARIWAAVKH